MRLTEFQYNTMLLFMFAVCSLALYNSGSREAHWKDQHTAIANKLAQERTTVKQERDNFDLIMLELQESRHDRQVCNEALQRYTADAERIVRERMARKRGEKKVDKIK